MKKVLFLAVVALIFGSCTKYNYIDTGVSVNNENETMYEYFKQDSYNWALLKQIIDKADLVSIFDGTNSNYKSFMFLGPVDNSIRKWMMDNKYASVGDIPEDICKNMIMRYVFNNKAFNRDQVPSGSLGTGDDLVNGGILMEAESGNEVWLYALKTPYMDNPSLLISTLFCVMMDTGEKGYIATHDLKKINGIIHSLDDSHQISNFK